MSTKITGYDVSRVDGTVRPLKSRKRRIVKKCYVLVTHRIWLMMPLDERDRRMMALMDEIFSCDETSIARRVPRPGRT